MSSGETARVFRYLGARVYRFFAGVILISVLLAVTAVLRAFLLRDAMNSAVAGQWEPLARSGILLSLVVLANILAQPRLWKMFMECGPLAAKDIREDTMETVQRLPMRFFEEGHSGDVISRINADIDAMLAVFGVRFRRFVTPVIHGLILSAAMLDLDWRFALVLIVLNALTAALNLLFAGPMRSGSAGIQKGFAALTGRAIDMLSGISCLKIFPMEERIFADFAGENRRLARAQAVRAAWEGGLAAMNAFLGFAGNLGAIFLGVFFVSRGRIDFGTLLAFSSLQTDLGRSFLEAAEYFPIVQRAFAGADRLFEILDRAPEPERHPCPSGKEMGAELALEDVAFGYSEDAPVLRGLSLSVPRGQVAALVGESGGGKSTILKLILGFYGASSGSIAIQGRPFGDYTLGEIRQLCAWVPQEPYLFDGTIEENIRFGRHSATREEVVAAAEGALALEFIAGLPDGFDTQVGQGGIRLSGGQRQRIAIARALLKDAPILLLDEATSHLDSRSERLVQDALAVLMRGRTSIVVAHRLSTIRRADAIHVVDGGRIAERGGHESLVERRGLYYRLWKRLQD